MKGIVDNLMAYLLKCEEELNTALVERSEEKDESFAALKSESSLATEEGEEKSNDHSISSETLTSDNDSVEQGPLSSDESVTSPCARTPGSVPKRRRVKRVTFAPNIDRVFSLFNDEDLLRCVEEKRNPFAFVTSDLDKCLANLKSDIRKMLMVLKRKYGNVSSQQIEISLLEDKISLLTEQLHIETQEKDKLMLELHEAKSFLQGYECERQTYVEQLKSLESNQESLIIELQTTKDRLADAESEKRRKEVVTEGYGENVQPSINRRLEDLAQIQDKGE